jgi:predicted DNA-binding protein
MKEKKDFLFTLKMTKSFKEKMEAFSDKLGITNACLVTLAVDEYIRRHSSSNEKN